MEYYERFAHGGNTVEDTPGDRPVYRAAIEGQRRAARFRVVYADGRVSIHSFSYLVDILYTNHQHLSLILSNFVLSLEGKNLHLLLDALQEDKIKVLQCYNATRFLDAPAEGVPVIVSIKRQSVREFTAAASGGVSGSPSATDS